MRPALLGQWLPVRAGHRFFRRGTRFSEGTPPPAKASKCSRGGDLSWNSRASACASKKPVNVLLASPSAFPQSEIIAGEKAQVELRALVAAWRAPSTRWYVRAPYGREAEKSGRADGYRVAVLDGDGIGPEVMQSHARGVLEKRPAWPFSGCRRRREPSPSRWHGNAHAGRDAEHHSGECHAAIKARPARR